MPEYQMSDASAKVIAASRGAGRAISGRGQVREWDGPPGHV